jgi:hypothetical protein
MRVEDSTAYRLAQKIRINFMQSYVFSEGGAGVNTCFLSGKCTLSYLFCGLIGIIYLEIISVRDGHGGGWSRKINAWYLYTLMVYL